MDWKLLPLLALLACDHPAPRTPEAAYRAFAEALRRGDAKTAWASLSSGTQRRLQTQAKAISEASKGLIKDDPALMLLQSGTRPAPVGEVKLESADAGAATLSVAGEAGPAQISMVREGERWVVELSDILQEKTVP